MDLASPAISGTSVYANGLIVVITWGLVLPAAADHLEQSFIGLLAPVTGGMLTHWHTTFYNTWRTYKY